jgi:hypothetical protein
MTNPNINVPVPEPAQTATKAIYTSLVLAVGWVALVVKSFADGSLSWAEGQELIGAAAVAGGSVFATWKTRNKPKS